jgi:hypothetical protein
VQLCQLTRQESARSYKNKHGALQWGADTQYPSPTTRQVSESCNSSDVSQQSNESNVAQSGTGLCPWALLLLLQRLYKNAVVFLMNIEVIQHAAVSV